MYQDDNVSGDDCSLTIFRRSANGSFWLKVKGKKRKLRSFKRYSFVVLIPDRYFLAAGSKRGNYSHDDSISRCLVV